MLTTRNMCRTFVEHTLGVTIKGVATLPKCRSGGRENFHTGAAGVEGGNEALSTATGVHGCLVGLMH